MEFSVKFNDFKRVATQVSEITPSKSNLGDPSGIKIESSKDRVILSSYCDGIFCKAWCEAEVKSEGSAHVESSVLVKALSGFKPTKADGTGTQDVDFLYTTEGINLVTSTVYKNGTIVPHKRLLLSFLGFVPDLPSLENDTSILGDPEVFSELVRLVVPFISSEDTRQIVFTGISTSFSENRLDLQSYGGPSWAGASANISSSEEKTSFDFIVPGKFMSKLPKFISTQDSICLKSSSSLFVVEGFDFVCGSCLIKGKFPDFSFVLNKDRQSYVINKSLLIDNLRNVVFNIDKEDNSRVSLGFSEENLSVTTRTCSNSNIPIRTDSREDFSIDFNLYLLQSILQIIPSEEIELLLEKPATPAVVRPVGLESETSVEFILTPLK